MDDSDWLSSDSTVGSGRPIANTHIHVPPNFSAFETAEQAVQVAAAEGVAVVGTSNYHDFRVYARFAAAAAEARILPLFGVEIIALLDDLPGGGTLVNDPTNLNRMYLCGKALTRLDPPIPAAARRMAAMRAASEDRMRKMTALIAARFAQFGLDGGVTDELIAASVAERSGVPIEWVSLQERHVAQAFQEALFRQVAPDERVGMLGRLFGAETSVVATDATAAQEAIRSNLMKAGKPAFIPEAAVSFDDAYQLILELGGIPCYPILADGTSPICPFEDPPEALAERLLSRGIYCAELIPGRNRRQVVDRYVAALRGAGIVVMAGTEHNTQRMIPLEPTALDGEQLSDISREAFWEGTCVVAAHQGLCESGEPGFVDSDGRPAAGFADAEARIRSFRRIGADLITARSAAGGPGVKAKSTAQGRPVVAGLLNDLVALSRRFGEDPEFARGGGGNSSVKADGILYIKPSGTWLAALTPESVIALDVRPLMELLDAPPERPVAGGTDEVMRVALGARVGVPDDRRPSVECLFHALLPERFVLHTHPTTVNAITCAKRGAEIAERLFGSSVLWVPYTDPGLPLARAIRDARRSHEERTGKAAPRAMLFQSHGLVVAGDSPAEIEETSARLVAAIRAHLTDVAPISWGNVERLGADQARAALHAVGPALRALLATGDRLKVVTFDDSPLAVSIAGSALGRELAVVGPLTPDQIVYTGSFPLLVEAPKGAAPDQLIDMLTGEIAARAATEAGRPAVVIVAGLGLFAAGDSYAQADTARQVYLDAAGVSAEAHRLGGVRPLAETERGFIERWEAEAYRQGVAAGGPVAGRARGLVVVVTGAAQGFGHAIAADVVAQGGHVVLADLNADLAKREAQALASEFGSGRTVGVALDVTDDASVAACFDEIVRRYGGLDVLVSNAGILRAGSVTSQPVAEFDAVTRVNYRGYFLCVRHAAPILARQHRSRPDYWGDIVEINSKSGLAGSSRNSAYAGSKFGGIGLTQSFALELVGDGIKVNAICPGNFLDGPLWADPNHGLFVQYLREGKVPGAKSVEDVRRVYEAKVPMGRGCTPADVLEALYYVVAQRYETGQAIPVTGGQVMLR